MSFRVLFLYPNLSMSSMVPQSIALLSAVLRTRGHETAVFDTTFYDVDLNDANFSKVRAFLVKPFNFGERGISKKGSDLVADFKEKVAQFKPDLLGVSFVEDTFVLGTALIQSIKDLDIPVIAGGPFCTYATDKVARCSDIDYIVRGEGEYALLELIESLASGKSYRHIQNLCYRENGTLVRNPLRPPVDLNELPVADYSIFEEWTMYRPMVGKIFKTVGVETQRGCPFTCGYCCSSANNRLYKEYQKRTFFRHKSMKTFAKEMEKLASTVQPELIYFLADVFLMMSDKEFDEFCAVYSQYKIPFFMNTRAETVTDKRIRRLKELNCIRANVGLEHGNEEFRAKVINRRIKNHRIVKAVEILGQNGISTAVNNIIGFPSETRELVFDTIELNRKIAYLADSVSCFIFAPYHGTALRELALEKGYLDEESLADTNTLFCSVLKMPQLPDEALRGLQRTFSMYVRFPKSRWPEIQVAESFSPEGEEMYKKFAEELREKFATG